MKTLIKLLLIILFPLQLIYSQPLDSLWMYYYGYDTIAEFALDIIPKYDSGYLVVGISEDTWEYKNDAYIMSIDKDGGFLWDKVIITSENDRFNEIIATSDSNYLIGGEFNGLAWLVKINENGDTLWSKQYGSDFGAITSLQRLSNDDIIITGENINQHLYFYLMKTDPFGDTLWTRKYNFGYPAPYSLSSHCVKQTLDGGYILSIGLNSAYGYQIPIFVKTDSNGDTLWTLKGADGLGISESYIPNILVDSDTLYFVGGGLTTSSGSGILLIKMHQDGDIIWVKNYGHPDFNEIGYSGIFSTNGNILIAGKISSTISAARIYMLEIDKNGNLIWDETYGGMDFGHTAWTISNTLDNNYIVAGFAFSDSFVLKLGEKPSQISPFKKQNNIHLRIVPNPVKSLASIDFEIAEKGYTILSIYNFQGKKIDELLRMELPKGYQRIMWDASNFNTGIFFVRIETINQDVVQKVIISR